MPANKKGGNIMKNKLHSLAVKFGTLVAVCAVTTSIITSNSTCMWLTYQPEEPEDIKALKKI